MEAYHESFYRSVEATSVTPFAPRAVDRGLAAVTVALARQGWKPLTPAEGAERIIEERGRMGYVTETIESRALAHSAGDTSELREKLQGRVKDLLDSWTGIANRKREVTRRLQYGSEVSDAGPLLYDPLDLALRGQPADVRKFKAGRSLRDVELSVNLWVKRLDTEKLIDEVEEL